jgi:hypothetical protein
MPKLKNAYRHSSLMADENFNFQSLAILAIVAIRRADQSYWTSHTK